LESVLNSLREQAKRRTKGYGCHSWDHAERVHDLCLLIGRREEANMEVLSAAALLHDIERSREGEHALQSAREAEKILKGLGVPVSLSAKISEAIRTHSHSAGRTPPSLEAKILSDADKLDAMGAVGIYRAFAFAAERQVNLPEMLKHFDEKLLRLKDLMHTQSAQKLAQKRHGFMTSYEAQILDELKMES